VSTRGFPLRSAPGVNTLDCLEEWRGKQRISPPGDKLYPWGITSPLGSKFAPRGKVKNGPQEPTSAYVGIKKGLGWHSGGGGNDGHNLGRVLHMLLEIFLPKKFPKLTQITVIHVCRKVFTSLVFENRHC
jgi:hypothetical protein